MKDYIVRATAANGQVRAFAATTRGVVETARKDHNTNCGTWKTSYGCSYDGNNDEE